MTRKASHQNIATDSQNSIMNTSLFIAGGNPLEFVTSGPTKLALPQSGGLEVYEIASAATTVTSADFGKTYLLSAAAGFTVTLPAPTFGARVSFIVRTSPTSNGYIIAGTAFRGSVSTADVDSTDAAIANNNNRATFVANAAVAGDKLMFESDGSSWFVTGQCAARTGITFATV